MMRAWVHRVAVIAAACVIGSTPFPVWAADQAEKLFELTLVDGVLPAAQQVMRVEKGDVVKWRVTSNAAGELHLHAYRLAATLVPGQPADVSFRAFATGRYRIEWHPASGKTEPRGAHHAQPLATLEVRPR